MDILRPQPRPQTIQEQVGECLLSSQEAGGRAQRLLREGAGAAQRRGRDRARSEESGPRDPRGLSSLQRWVS